MARPTAIPGASPEYRFGYRCALKQISRSTLTELATAHGGLWNWIPDADDYEAFCQYLGRDIEDEMTSDECGLFQSGYVDCCGEVATALHAGWRFMIPIEPDSADPPR